MGGIVTVAAFYPGVMSPDSLDQLRQARAWTYTTSVPPLMTLLWSALDSLVPGPALMLLLQVGAWWGGLYLLARRLVRAAPLTQAAVVLFVGLWPPLFAMIGTIWRDVHLTLALLMSIALLLRAEGRPDRRMTATAGVLVAYASAVRVNAILSVIPLAGWVAWQWSGGRAAIMSGARRRAALIACVVCLVFGGRWIERFIATTIVHPEQCVEVFDLVGISSRTGTNLVPGSIRNGFDRPERIAASYNAFTWLPAYWGPMRDGVLVEPRLLSTEDRATLAQIHGAWWSAVRAHPRAYLAHRAAVFAAAMGWDALPIFYPYERGVPVNDLGLVSRPSGFSALVYRGLDLTPLRLPWIWRPWVFVWIDLMLLAACLRAWTQGVVTPRTVLVLSSALLYSLPYFVLAPAAELRYQHWSLAATFVALMLFAWELRSGSPAGALHALGLSRRSAALASGAIALATIGLFRLALHSHVDFGDAAPRPERAIQENGTGVRLLARGEFAPALQWFRAATARDPHWWVPETNLGLAAAGLGRPGEALEHHDRAVRLDRAAAGARVYRGEFLMSLGRWDEARTDFETARAAGWTDERLARDLDRLPALPTDGSGMVLRGRVLSEVPALRP